MEAREFIRGTQFHSSSFWIVTAAQLESQFTTRQTKVNAMQLTPAKAREEVVTWVWNRFFLHSFFYGKDALQPSVRALLVRKARKVAAAEVDLVKTRRLSRFFEKLRENALLTQYDKEKKKRLTEYERILHAPCKAHARLPLVKFLRENSFPVGGNLEKVVQGLRDNNTTLFDAFIQRLLANPETVDEVIQVLGHVPLSLVHLGHYLADYAPIFIMQRKATISLELVNRLLKAGNELPLEQLPGTAQIISGLMNCFGALQIVKINSLSQELLQRQLNRFQWEKIAPLFTIGSQLTVLRAVHEKPAEFLALLEGGQEKSEVRNLLALLGEHFLGVGAILTMSQQVPAISLEFCNKLLLAGDELAVDEFPNFLKAAHSPTKEKSDKSETGKK